MHGVPAGFAALPEHGGERDKVVEHVQQPAEQQEHRGAEQGALVAVEGAAVAEVRVPRVAAPLADEIRYDTESRRRLNSHDKTSSTARDGPWQELGQLTGRWNTSAS